MAKSNVRYGYKDHYFLQIFWYSFNFLNGSHWGYSHLYSTKSSKVIRLMIRMWLMSGVPFWVGLCSIIGQFWKFLTKRVSLVFLFLRQVFKSRRLGVNSSEWLKTHHSFCHFLINLVKPILAKTSKSGREYFRLGAESYLSLESVGKKRRK